MATFIEAFGNEKGQTKILIPLLQRDYVQGGAESVISPFLDQLLSGKEVDLNYIYGYEENGCFIPIDGQQRLITLWLLHLYIASVEEVNASFTVDLSFKGREFANDFCEAIKRYLQENLHSVEETGNLSDVLKNQSWFMASWSSSLTVRCMLKTLDYIHRKYKPNNSCTWQMLTSEDCKITFSFLKMDGKDGLDDDIYIKMNGRGRALSDFENLKSWMDEHICFVEDKKVAEWKLDMDNKWTDFFWKNRNPHQEHPEEIDDEQLFCFCNLLILYWMMSQNLELLNARLKNISDYQKEELQILLTKSERGKLIPSEELLSYFFDYLNEGNMMPLVWLERLSLMDKGFFEFAQNALDILSELSERLNQYQDQTTGKYLYFGDMGGNTFMYNVALCKGTYSKTLPLLYAILSLCKGKIPEEELYQRLRVMRNLVENTTIGKKELVEKVLPAIDVLSTKLANNVGILQYLCRALDAKEALKKGFTEAQADEEILKAEYAHTSLMVDIEEMENSSFFRGKIICMFNFLQDTEGYDDFTKVNFQKYKAILMTIFPSKDDGGIAKSLDDSEYLLRRALLSMPDHDYGYWHSGWSFCQSSEEWRNVLADSSNGVKFGSIRPLTQILAAKVTEVTESGIHDFLKKYVDAEATIYYGMLSVDTTQICYWMHFVCHPGIWEYMGTKVIRKENENSIFLKTSNGNNCNKMELRTYGLYLDFSDTSIFEDMKKMREGWNFGKWQRDQTCLYFDIDFLPKDKPNVQKIAIDVYHNRTKENDYVYNLFVRTKDDVLDEKAEAILNEEVFHNYGLEAIIKDFGLTQDGNECEWLVEHTGRTVRFLPRKAVSRVKIIEELSKLLPRIRNIVNSPNGTM